MKRIVVPFLCFCLMFSFLAASFGSASASSELPDPAITSISGDRDFNTKFIGTASLPGTTYMENGMLIPAGFPAGEKQFEGRALKITGLDNGKILVCFPFNGIQYGWGGQVGMWNESKWNLLPTTITTPAESRISYACSTIQNNGYYAFIKWVADPSKLPAKTPVGKPVCDFTIDFAYFMPSNVQNQPDRIILEVSSIGLETSTEQDLSGSEVTVYFRDVLPEGSIIFSPVTGTLSPLPGFGEYRITVFPTVQVTLFTTLTNGIWVFDFGYCEQTFSGSEA